MRDVIGPNLRAGPTDCLVVWLAAVSKDMVGWYTKHLEEYYADNEDALQEVTTTTALKLFPRFERLINQCQSPLACT